MAGRTVTRIPGKQKAANGEAQRVFLSCVKARDAAFCVVITARKSHLASRGVGGSPAQRFRAWLQKTRVGAIARMRGAQGQFPQALGFSVHARQYRPMGKHSRK